MLLLLLGRDGVVNTSAPDANESINKDNREAPKFGSFRISSRSSLNPSATDAIQNFRNLAFINCSLDSISIGSPAFIKAGSSTGGGEGEGDVRRTGLLVAAIGCCAPRVGAAGLAGSGSDSESEDESDEDSEEDDVSG